MNEGEFERFLKRGGRSQSVRERITNHIRTFEQYIRDVLWNGLKPEKIAEEEIIAGNQPRPLYGQYIIMEEHYGS